MKINTLHPNSAQEDVKLFFTLTDCLKECKNLFPKYNFRFALEPTGRSTYISRTIDEVSLNKLTVVIV